MRSSISLRAVLAFSLALAILGLAAGPAGATTLTWDATAGGAINDGAGAWLGAGQWNNGSPSATWTSGDDAIFGVGGAGGAVTLASPTAVGLLTLNSFTGTYTLGTAGQAITLNSGITINAGAGATTIVSPVTLGGAQTWLNNSTGTLTVGTAALANGGNLLTIDGTGSTFLTAAISGLGGITKNGSGYLRLQSTANTYSGTTTINGGTVLVWSPASTSLGSGNLTLNGGVLEHYWSDNFTRTLGSVAGQVQILGGASGFSENGATGMNVILNNNAAYEVVWGAANEAGNVNATGFFNPSTLALQAPSSQAGATLNFQNKIDLNGTTRTVAVNVTTTANATMSGVIRNSTGTAGLTKTGNGMLKLSGANTFNGGVTINQGTLSINSINNVASANPLGQSTDDAANLLLANGTTLQYTGGAANCDRSFTINGTAAGQSATLDASGSGAVNFSSAASPAYGTADQTRTLILSGTSTAANTLAANIADNGAGAVSLTKTGAGLWVLSGANAYTGTTTVSAGTLQFAKTASLYNGNTASWTAANINVKSGATLLLNVDSAGTAGFTSASLGTLLGNISVASTAAEGLQGGAKLVFDTTTATGGIFTLSNAIANSTGAFGGAISVTKLGAGTLVLDQANTYAGPTTITTGVLQLGNNTTTGVLSSSGVITIGTGANLTINRSNAAAQGTDFSGADISGLGSFTQAGTGTTTLNVANTYSGATTVSAGVLSLANALAIQNSALVTTGAGAVTLTGVTTPTFGGLSGATGDLATVISTGYSGVTALTLNPQSGITFTYGGVIANGLPAGMTLTKTGAGTQILQGANTYSGATNINAGILTVSGASGDINASTVIALNGGGLTLDNSSTTGGNLGTRVSDSAVINVNGNSALKFVNNAQASTNYTETMGTLALQSGFLTYTGSQAAGTGTSILTIDTLSRSGTATVNFAGTGLGTNTQNEIKFNNGVTSGNDLGPWAVVNGADFATYDTTLGVKAAANTTLLAGSNDAATNFKMTGGGITIDASLNPSYKTLLVSDTTARTLAINGNTVSVGGISSSGNNHIISGTGALQALNAGDALYLNVGSNSLTINSVIQNVGAGATASALVKYGTGTLTLGGANTFSGDIVINAGTIDNANVGTFGTGSNITFAGSGTVIPAYGASPVFAKSIAVNPGVTATLNVPNQYYNMTFTAPVTGDATSTLSVICSDNGAGSVTLSNASNMFTGTLQVGDATYGSTLTVNSLADSVNPIKLYGNSSRPAYFNLGAGTASSLLFDSRQIQLLGGAGASAFIRNNNGTTANTITINTDLSVGASVNRTLTLGGSNTGTNTFAGKIGDGPGAVINLTKADAGTWILSGANTYTGATTVSGGTLQIGNGGTTGSLSPGSAITNNATLRFNRSNTITQGTDFSSVIAGTGALVQAGSGTTILTGTNTYTGVTTVNAGTLLINSPGSLASGSAVTVNNGGTLGGNGTINGTVTVAAGGHIAPGASVGPLNVNNNVAVTTGVWDIDLNASTSAIDLLNITGNLTWTGTQTLNLNILDGAPAGGPYTFATWTGTGTTPVGTWNVVPSGTAAANHWIGGAGLLWDTQANWTPNTALSGSVALSGKNLQLTTSVVNAPASVSSIYIDPSANVAVTGPASGGKQTVNNLTIGQGLGAYTAALALQAGGDLTVTGTTTVRSDGTLTASDAGLITPILNVNGGLATLGNASDNVGTANVTAGTLTVNNVGAANLTANLSGTGSLAGSAAVNQVNVTAGTPAFSGNATAMTITGGGITTTGGTIGTFNSNTGAGTSTIGSGTAVTTAANVAAGIVNFNSTQANGTLAVTGGAVNIGSGAKVATANFQSGAGTVNAANPLAITSTLKLAGGITATLAGGTSFTAAGANLANTGVANTLSLSGGTLAVSVPGIGAPINLSSTGLNIADATHIKAASYYAPDRREAYRVSDWSGMTGSVGASGTADNGYSDKTWLDYPNQTGTSWISWDLGAEYTIGSIHIWNYNEVNLPQRGTKKLNLQTGDATAFASNTGWVSQLSNVDWTAIGANGTISDPTKVQGTGQNGYAGFDWTLPAPITTRYLRFQTLEHFAGGDSVGLSEVLFYTAVVTEVNLPKTTIAATSASTFDTSGSPATLGGLAIKGGSLTIGGDAPTDLTMVDGFTYRWEYSGGDGDKVAVTGDLTLAGAWTLDLGGATTPTAGVKYDLFTYDTFSGTEEPTTILNSEVPGWPTPTIGQYTTAGVGHIYMMFGAMGDTNGDDVVDAADYITVKQNFGRTDATLGAEQGDFDKNGNVDWDDLQLLMANFSTRSIGGAPATPEPATLGLLAIGALAVLRRRRRAA